MNNNADPIFGTYHLYLSEVCSAPPNGLELTCGAVLMPRYSPIETKLILIYRMPFQTADCLDHRARACRADRLSELLANRTTTILN